MNWQRGARLGLAAVGIGTAVALVALRRERPSTESPLTSLTPADTAATAEGGPGTRMVFEGSENTATMTVSSWKRYADPDRTVSYTVHLLFKEEGLQMWADEAEIKADPASTTPSAVTFNGRFRLEKADGLRASSDRATYDHASGVIDMPGLVTFSKGRMTGEGVHSTYNRPQELLQFASAAKVQVAPEADGRGAITASAGHLTLARLEKLTRLDGDAVIDTDTESLKADAATLYFTDDERHLKLVDLVGRASVDPRAPGGPGDPAAAAKPPLSAMRADAITLAFHDMTNVVSRSTMTGNGVATMTGGRRVAAPWMDFATAADGTTVTSIDARPAVRVDVPAGGGTPARVIEAGVLAARGQAAKGLTSARFDAPEGGLVLFRELAANGRGIEGRSRVLVLALNGGLEAIDQAEFRDAVVFQSENGTRAEGSQAVYRVAAHVLRLERRGRESARAAEPQPSVAQDGLHVRADVVTVGVESRDLDAKGEVVSRSAPSANAGRRPTAIFEEGKDVLGVADSLAYVATTRVATYRGTSAVPARVSQADGSQITGDVIVVDDTKGSLSARRRVEASFAVTDATYRLTGDEFDYADDTRRATARGGPATLQSTDRNIEATHIALTIERESRRLEALTATERVYTTLDRDYEATGDRLDYDAAADEYILTGAIVEVRGPDEGRKGCLKSTGGTLARFHRASRQVSWPARPDGRPQRVMTESWPCEKSIR